MPPFRLDAPLILSVDANRFSISPFSLYNISLRREKWFNERFSNQVDPKSLTFCRSSRRSPYALNCNSTPDYTHGHSSRKSTHWWYNLEKIQHVLVVNWTGFVPSPDRSRTSKNTRFLSFVLGVCSDFHRRSFVLPPGLASRKLSRERSSSERSWSLNFRPCSLFLRP